MQEQKPKQNKETITNEKKTFTDPVTGKFVKGNPGGGRPAGVRSFTTKVKEALEKIADGTNNTYEQLFIKKILKKAIVDGDSKMMTVMWEQLDGKPAQKIVAQVQNTNVEVPPNSKKGKKIVERFNEALRQSLNNDDEDEE